MYKKKTRDRKILGEIKESNWINGSSVSPFRNQSSSRSSLNNTCRIFPSKQKAGEENNGTKISISKIIEK
jgi:hypothetical protein